MRGYLAGAPAWLKAAIQALVAVAWVTVWDVLNDHHTTWLRAFAFAVLAAAMSAPFEWFGRRRRRAAIAGRIGGLTQPQQDVVLRAARTGVPPDDLALRPVALEMARYRLAESTRGRTAAIVIFSFLILLMALLTATDGSLGYLFGAVLFLGALIWALREPSQQRRRIATLEASCGWQGGTLAAWRAARLAPRAEKQGA